MDVCLSGSVALICISAKVLTLWLDETNECIMLQVMMVLMHNTREVPAEWQIKAPADAGAAMDWAYFRCEPEQGLLPPGEKQCLKASLAMPAALQHMKDLT